MKRLLLLLLSTTILGCSGINTSNRTADDNFVGVWKYYTSTYEKGNAREDATMHGLMATIKKMENTDESYMLNYINFEIPFTKLNDTLLQSTVGTFIAMYHPSTERLVLFVGTDNTNEFTKMK